MSSVVILGGNSISYEIGKVLKKKFRVIYIFRKKKKFFKNFEQIVCKTNDYSEYKKIFKKIKPKYVLNMYSVISRDINLIYKINLKLSLFLISFFSNTNSRLILIGSAAEYGTSNSKKYFKENDILKPNNYYGLSKAIQSTILMDYAKLISTKIIVLRIFNVYGEIYNKNLLIGKINNLLIKNNKIFKVGSLKDYRDYSSSQKIAKMIVRCFTLGKCYNIYNIGSGKLIKVRKFLNDYLKKLKLTNYKIIEKKILQSPNFSAANLNKYKNI